MNTLDDLLDQAATDLQNAVAEVPIPSRFVSDELNVVYRTDHATSYRSRRILVAAAAIAAVVVGGLFLIERRPADRPADNPASSSVATPTTIPLFDPAQPPVELTIAPAGFALVGQVVRPAGGGQDIRSAVFVRRDEQGTIDGKILARFGNFGVIGVDPSDGSLLPPNSTVFYQQVVTPPPNLAAATSSNVYIDLGPRMIYLQFPLGDLGSLTLQSFNLDAANDLVVAQQMQQIAATLQLTPTAINVTGALPDGWELAVSGLEPETLNQTFFQAYEVDTPAGGNKVLISNMSTNDAAMPYWEMDETLQPLDIRGHAGFVSTHTYPPTNPNFPPPGNPANSTTLIWPETPGHWVILRADDMNTDQVIALANQLTPAHNGQWQLPGASTATTTTLAPTQPT